MLKLQLDDIFRIEADIASWNLISEDPKGISEITGLMTYTKHYTFHATLEQAVRTYLDERMKRGQPADITVKELTSLIFKINEAENNIREILEKYSISKNHIR